MRRLIIFLMVVLMSSFSFAATVSHEASQINSGNFSGNYNFEGDLGVSSLNVTGSSILNGNVGIGTNSPSDKIHIANTVLDANVGYVVGNDARQWRMGVRGDTSDVFAIQDDTL